MKKMMIKKIKINNKLRILIKINCCCEFKSVNLSDFFIIKFFIKIIKIKLIN